MMLFNGLVERNTSCTDSMGIGPRQKTELDSLPSTDEMHLIYYQNIVLSAKLEVATHRFGR